LHPRQRRRWWHFASSPSCPVRRSRRRYARAAPGPPGRVWCLVTFISSIPGLGCRRTIQIGALLEIGLVISGIATAIVFWPVIRRQSEVLSPRLRGQPDHRVGPHRHWHRVRAGGAHPPRAPELTAVGLDTAGQAPSVGRSPSGAPSWCFRRLRQHLRRQVPVHGAGDRLELFVGIYLTFHGYRTEPLRVLLERGHRPRHDRRGSAVGIGRAVATARDRAVPWRWHASPSSTRAAVDGRLFPPV
jgi:hypothetical protein